MKWLLWLVGIAVLILALVGFLPPVLARGTLDTDTVDAAKAGSSALGTGGATAVQAAVEASLAKHPDVVLKSVTIAPPATSGSIVTVTTTESVHSWLSGISALDGWFHITSTQQSSLGA